MTCPHSTRPGAGACSQCVDGALVHRVTQRGSELLVDGKRVRSIDAADDERRLHYARRGGLAHGRRTR